MAGEADLRAQPPVGVRAAPPSDRPLGELFSELGGELGALVRTELALAKTEAREEATRAARAGAMFGGAGLEAYFALLFASLALAWLLDEVMHVALAFLIVGVLHGIVAFVLYRRARGQAARVEPLPQTTASLKEDLR
jgi:hypothetical protein